MASLTCLDKVTTTPARTFDFHHLTNFQNGYNRDKCLDLFQAYRGELLF